MSRYYQTQVGLVIILILVVCFYMERSGSGPRPRPPADSQLTWENQNPCYRFPKKIDMKELNQFSPMDKLVLDYIRCHHLTPPSRVPYQMNVWLTDPSEFRRHLNIIFGNTKGGFFIECGANDGLYLSNTFALERTNGWSGLLVEANPKLRSKLLEKNRKAWFADVCLSPDNTISEMEFLVSDGIRYQWETGIGKIAMPDDVDTLYKANTDKYNFRPYGKISCFPLLSILKALNVSHVDYFSLDVQGVELKILKTLPFDTSLEIDVFQVEHLLVPEGKTVLRSYVENKGYKTVYDGKETYIFIRKNSVFDISY